MIGQFNIGDIKMEFKYNDGGRKSAGYKGENVGDCVARALSITTQGDYKQIYDFLASSNKEQRKGKRKGSNTGKLSAQHGINTSRKWFKDYMTKLGFKWYPTMQVGKGCQIHLKTEELPQKGRLVVSVSKHFTSVIDGVIHDTYDPSRNGTRCVYGYWLLVEKIKTTTK